MNRRESLKHLGLGAAGAVLPLTSHALPGRDYRNVVPEIHASVPPPPSHSQALIIGSGFGGAISALRLAQAGVQTTVLERGFKWPRDPWRDIFTQDLLPDGRGYWYRNSSKTLFGLPGTPVDSFGGVVDVTEYEHIDVWRGACVGGGSMVFSGAMLQPQRSYFDALFGGRVSNDEMNSLYYPRVRQMLRLSPMPDDVYNASPFGHSRTWDRDVRKAGYTPTKADGIWNWDVVRREIRGQSRPSCIVGRSNHGNSNGAKFDLNQNYLLQAEATGLAKVHPGHEVKNLGFDGARYNVDVILRSPDGTVLERSLLTCDRLFLAAGSIGTTELLMRARALGGLAQLNEHIGTGWGTNGGSHVARSLAFSFGLTQGAACASKIHDTRGGLPLTLENWYAPGVPINLPIIGSLALAFDQSHRADFSYDASTDRVRLNWPAHGNNDAVAAARAVNNRIASASWTIPGVPLLVPDVYGGVTAHPLGGAVIGRACDNHGRVIGHPGLYVMDGAFIPGSAGAANPALTISALAERNIAHIIANGG